MHDLPFLSHPHTIDAITKLNQVIRDRATAIVHGPARTGKTALVHYWSKQDSMGLHPDQVLILNLLTAGKKSDKDPFLPAQTVDLMQRMDAMIRRLRNPPDRRPVLLLDSREGRKTRPPSPTTILNRVWSGIEDGQIQAIVLDNAQLIQAGTLAWLHDLREMLEFPISFIFVAQTTDGEPYPKGLYRGLHQIPALENDVLETISLERITVTYYFEHLFEPLLNMMGVELPEPPESQQKNVHQAYREHIRTLTKATWSLCNGDWIRIKRLATVIQRYRTLHPREKHELTIAMIDEITHMMTPLPTSDSEPSRR